MSPSPYSHTPPTHPTGTANKWAKLDSSWPSRLCHHMCAASSPYSQWTIILPSPQLLKPELENHHHLPLPFPQNPHASGHQVASVLFNLKSAHASPSSTSVQVLLISTVAVSSAVTSLSVFQSLSHLIHLPNHSPGCWSSTKHESSLVYENLLGVASLPTGKFKLLSTCDKMSMVWLQHTPQPDFLPTHISYSLSDYIASKHTRKLYGFMSSVLCLVQRKKFKRR